MNRPGPNAAYRPAERGRGWRMLERHSKQHYPQRCRIIGVRYLGDEGSISCTLDFGSEHAENARIVSITHLDVDRRHPLAPEIKAYIKRRIKRVKKFQQGEAFG